MSKVGRELRLRLQQRKGSTMVEFAIVTPVVLLLMFGLIVGGFAVSKLQQIASVAREGSRWASVHGAAYAAQTGLPAATQTDICNQAKTKAPGLNLICDVTYNPAADNHQTHEETKNGVTSTKANTVAVRVRYIWTPEMFAFIRAKPDTMVSTSVSVMSF